MSVYYVLSYTIHCSFSLFRYTLMSPKFLIKPRFFPIIPYSVNSERPTHFTTPVLFPLLKDERQLRPFTFCTNLSNRLVKPTPILYSLLVPETKCLLGPVVRCFKSVMRIVKPLSLTFKSSSTVLVSKQDPIVYRSVLLFSTPTSEI